ncbi:hypothetical protein, partial [Paenibacillus mesophilus]|uniref:hypothetical protein n=1 Tax=Paenibacillus mesophilus TaxID=2582849 RepID=UPI001EE40A77
FIVASWNTSICPFLLASSGQFHVTRGLFLVQTANFFITGMLPDSSMKKKSSCRDGLLLVILHYRYPLE